MRIFDAAVLADGQLPDSVGTLYTAPVDSKVFVKKIRCTNRVGALQAVSIFKRSNGADDRLIGYCEDLAEGETFVIENEIMEDGDLIRGFTDDAASVDYVIDGVVETEVEE